MKRILRLCLLTALLPLLSSCCVADWWHDWYYGDKPLPQSPIAPIAKPMPDKYSAADAVALMTDSLIFALSGVSGNGLPVVHYVITQKPQPLAEKVYRSLLQSRIIRPSAGG